MPGCLLVRIYLEFIDFEMDPKGISMDFVEVDISIVEIHMDDRQQEV